MHLVQTLERADASIRVSVREGVVTTSVPYADPRCLEIELESIVLAPALTLDGRRIARFLISRSRPLRRFTASLSDE